MPVAQCWASTDCFSLMLHLPGNILFPGSLWCIIQQDRSDHTIMACFLLKRIYSCLREMLSLHWCLMIARRSSKTFQSKIAWKYRAELVSDCPSCLQEVAPRKECYYPSGGFFCLFIFIVQFPQGIISNLNSPCFVCSPQSMALDVHKWIVK